MSQSQGKPSKKGAVPKSITNPETSVEISQQTGTTRRSSRSSTHSRENSDDRSPIATIQISSPSPEDSTLDQHRDTTFLPSPDRTTSFVTSTPALTEQNKGEQTVSTPVSGEKRRESIPTSQWQSILQDMQKQFSHHLSQQIGQLSKSQEAAQNQISEQMTQMSKSQEETHKAINETKKELKQELLGAQAAVRQVEAQVANFKRELTAQQNEIRDDVIKQNKALTARLNEYKATSEKQLIDLKQQHVSDVNTLNSSVQQLNQDFNTVRLESQNTCQLITSVAEDHKTLEKQLNEFKTLNQVSIQGLTSVNTEVQQRLTTHDKRLTSLEQNRNLGAAGISLDNRTINNFF